MKPSHARRAIVRMLAGKVCRLEERLVSANGESYLRGEIRALRIALKALGHDNEGEILEAIEATKQRRAVSS